MKPQYSWRHNKNRGTQEKAHRKSQSDCGKGLECCNPLGHLEKLASFPGRRWSSLDPRTWQWMEVAVLHSLWRRQISGAQVHLHRDDDPRALKQTSLAIHHALQERQTWEGTGQ